MKTFIRIAASILIIAMLLGGFVNFVKHVNCGVTDAANATVEYFADTATNTADCVSGKITYEDGVQKSIDAYCEWLRTLGVIK